MKKKFWAVILGIAAHLAACTSSFHTCYETRTCKPTGGAGGEGGIAGEAGAEAGEGGGFDIGSAAGSSGEVNGEGGAAGEMIADGGAAGEGESGGPRCGNGRVELAETCDDGTNNGPGKSCNSQCAPNVCGDGDKGPSEACDDGAENRLALLHCAPDCSRVVNIKHVVFSPKSLPNGNLAPNPVAAADSTCPEGYKALFSYGKTRRATTTPFRAQNAVDWVLQPYTYYYSSYEKPVWLTDAVPLLGVRNGQFTAFENRVDSIIAYVATGLNSDYTTLVGDDCQGWSGVGRMSYGLVGETSGGFVAKDTVECSGEIWFICVEQ